MRTKSSDPPLRKEDIEAGFVLWLRRHASSLDRNAYLRSQLEDRACDHPVLIIDTLDPSHDLVWVLIMTSTHNSHYKTIPIFYHTWINGKLALSECSGCRGMHAAGKTDGILFHKIDDARMNQHGHVGVERVYEVSLAMLRQERDEPAMGYYGVDYRSIELVKEIIKPAMDKLERTSYALKVCPRHQPICFDDLPPPIPDFDPNAGYTTGMVALSPVPECLTLSTQPSESASSASSKLMSHSKSATGTAVDSNVPVQLASQSTRVHNHGQTERAAITTVVKAPVKPCTAATSLVNHPLAISSDQVSKDSAVPKPATTRPSALTATRPYLAPFQTQRDINGLQVVIGDHIKPGAILWNQPGKYNPNKSHTQHIRDTKDRPCVVLRVCETTCMVQLVNITSLNKRPLSQATGIPASKKRYYLPFATYGHAASMTALTLHIADNKSLGEDYISYANANQLLCQLPATVTIPREGQRRLTDASLRLLLKVCEEAKAEKHVGLTDISLDQNRDLVKHQQSAKISVSPCLGISTSPVSVKTSAIENTTSPKSRVLPQKALARDCPGGPRSGAPPHTIAEAERELASSAEKQGPKPKTNTISLKPAKAIEAEPKSTTQTLATAILAPGKAGEVGLNDKKPLAPGPVLTLPAPVKIVQARLDHKKVFAIPPPAVAKVPEAQLDNATATATTLKLPGSASASAASQATITRLSEILANPFAALLSRSLPTTTKAPVAQSSVKHISKPDESSTGLGSGMEVMFETLRSGSASSHQSSVV